MPADFASADSDSDDVEVGLGRSPDLRQPRRGLRKYKAQVSFPGEARRVPCAVYVEHPAVLVTPTNPRVRVLGDATFVEGTTIYNIQEVYATGSLLAHGRRATFGATQDSRDDIDLLFRNATHCALFIQSINKRFG
jgi:hypothetical protein